MTTESAYDGEVDWSGDNPGMYLKESADGPFVTLISFFRVVLSPHGRGTALLMLQSPQAEAATPAAPNLCITDNATLARYLVDGFAGHYPAFKGCAALRGLEYRKLTGAATSGDARESYVETVRGEGLEVRLAWEGLGKPFILDLPVGKSITGKHAMLTVFVGAARASATVNGRALPGQPVPHQVAGRPVTSAFLALSETWIRV